MKYDVEDFTKEVIERSHDTPVVVDFWADWCAPCKILGPVLERLATEGDGRWTLAKVDTEKHREVAAQYNIRSIPNVKLFVEGKAVAEFVGALPEQMVRQWLKKEMPSKFRKEITYAEQLLLEGKSDEAQKILEGIVKGEPENHKALVMLAQSYLYTDQAKALSLVAGIEEDSEFFDVADSVSTFATLFTKDANNLPAGNAKQAYVEAIQQLRSNKLDAAIEKFIEVIREDRYYDDDGSRKACIAIFRILGEGHEITQKYRREFSRALF